MTDYIRTAVIGDGEERMSINSRPSSRNSTTPATPTSGTFFNSSPNACRPYQQQQQQQYFHYPQQHHSQQQPSQVTRSMMTPPLSQYSLFPPPSSWDWCGLPKSVSGGTTSAMPANNSTTSNNRRRPCAYCSSSTDHLQPCGHAVCQTCITSLPFVLRSACSMCTAQRVNIIQCFIFATHIYFM